MMDFFNKKEEKTKSIDRDIGFVEDLFGMVCDMVAYEDHSEGSFISKKEDSPIINKDWMRKMRSYYLDIVTKNVKGNDWCQCKHLCRVAKGLQELSARFISIGDIESAKKCAEDYGEVYLKFLELTGYTSGETNNESSA